MVSPTHFVTLTSLLLIAVEARPREASAPDPRAGPSSLLEPLYKSKSRDAAGTNFFKLLMHDEASMADSREIGSDSVNMNTNEACRPSPDPRNAQYVVGYGSLMQRESKTRTAPDTGTSVPVLIRGFRREWNTRGVAVGPSTTYLGVVHDDGDRNGNNRNANVSSFNAVVFKLPVTVHNLHTTLKSYDEREEFYCRQKVPNANVVPLLRNEDGIDPNADFWIYVNKPEFTAPASDKYPIVQSYVDVFVSGCLELEKEYSLPNFTDFCISSTKGWSPQWVNDRIFPRRPFLHQPYATAIDKALAKNLPNIFDKIVIEG